MSTMPTQSFENHQQRVPGFLTLAAVLALCFMGACVNLYHSLGDHQRLYSASLLVVLTGCLIAAGYYARTFALRAQDRAIRAEENLRHYVLTGKLLDPRINIRQAIALRFASDAEFPQLAAAAADQRLDSKSIKMQIKSWRADFYRV